jgi:hypothetical protein
VLDGLVRGTGAAGGVLGRGNDVLARSGGGRGAPHRHELPAGREAFWLELEDGTEPPESLRVAAAVVLSTWVARDELKQARFAERRRLWEVESLRAIAEALGGTLEPARIVEELLMHVAALLDARRGEVWLIGGGGAQPGPRLSGAEQTGVCETGECVMAARVGAPCSRPRGPRCRAGPAEPERLAVPVVGRRGRLAVLALAEREVREAPRRSATPTPRRSASTPLRRRSLWRRHPAPGGAGAGAAGAN